MEAKLDSLILKKSSHPFRGAGMCAMEAVAWLNNEPHSDAPSCTAAPIRRFVIKTNDWCNDTERQLLKPFLRRLISTSSVGREADKKAAFMFADWAVREIAPMALDAKGRSAEAAGLRGLAQIVDRETALVGRDKAYAADAAAAADAADAAAYGAYAAAYAAYGAYAAAYAAAYADAAYGAAAGRKTNLESRLAILDKILKEAYNK